MVISIRQRYCKNKRYLTTSVIYCRSFAFDAYWLAGWPEICSSAGGRSVLTSVTAELGFPKLAVGSATY